MWFERRADLEQIMESKNNPVGPNTVLGLDSDGVPRAYARLTKNKDGAKAHGFCAVDPQWQRRGVGSALLSWLESADKAAVRGGCRRRMPAGRARTARGRCHGCGCSPSRSSSTSASLLEESGYEVVRYYNEMHRRCRLRCPRHLWTTAWNWCPWNPG